MPQNLHGRRINFQLLDRLKPILLEKHESPFPTFRSSTSSSQDVLIIRTKNCIGRRVQRREIRPRRQRLLERSQVPDCRVIRLRVNRGAYGQGYRLRFTVSSPPRVSTVRPSTEKTREPVSVPFV